MMVPASIGIARAHLWRSLPCAAATALGLTGVFASDAGPVGRWILVGAMFVAVFAMIIWSLLPRAAEGADADSARSVRTPPGPASWSSGWSRAKVDTDIEAPETERPQHTRPSS